MEFEWDEAKRLGNIEKHGIDFADMEEIFDERAKFTAPSSRGEEERSITTAMIGDLFYTVIWTTRNNGIIRIISAGRARGAEKREYREVHERRTQGDDPSR